jgi:uncharacterized protein (DUF58 family)
MTLRQTHRWYGVAAVAFFAAAVGTLSSRPSLLLVGVVGVGYAAYARLTAAPEVSLTIDRTLSDPEPGPGADIEVSVSLTNTGVSLLDLRFIDGVPPGLEVVEGSPRLGTALRPGKTASFSYTVEATRGQHEFGPATILARDASGAEERELEQSVETTLTCIPSLPPPGQSVPLRPQTAQYTGPVPTTSGGAGVEFYATREYRPGDAMTRVDWSRLARTGELSTVEFREERMATVVLVIDARQSAYSSDPEGTPALEHAITAARSLTTSLLDDGHQVGVAAFGAEPCWLAPTTGEEQRAAIRRLLAIHPGLKPTPPSSQIVVSRRVRELRRQLPANAQVILLTPLIDDYIATIAGRLDAYGHAATVLSPDVTGTATSGQRLAGTERDLRMERLRGHQIPVIDWTPTDPLDHAFGIVRARQP